MNKSETKSHQRALLRLEEFEFEVQQRVRRRSSAEMTSSQAKLTLYLACHAALPVLLNAEIVHLLRINFFNGVFKKGEVLPYAAEQDLLFSDLCAKLREHPRKSLQMYAKCF